MNYALLLMRITELGAQIISNGASSDVTPLRMKLLCKEYGYTEPVFAVNTTGVSAQAIDPDGNPVSAMYPIEFGESDFGKLEALDELCMRAGRELPDEETLLHDLKEIYKKSYSSKAGDCFAAVLGGTGFAIMFGCNIYDCITCVVSCLIIVLLGEYVKKLSTNTFVFNALMSLIVESFILMSAKYIGVCQHPDRVALGVIMLLISGLGVTDGLESLMNNETSLGLHKISNSVIGAAGIAAGIALPLTMIRMDTLEGFTLNDTFVVQTLACTVACVGFGMWFKTSKRILPYIALCSCATWIVYSLVYSINPSIFVATVVAAAVESVMAVLISARMRIFPQILVTVSMFPLIPGPNLFYMLYGFVCKDNALVQEQFMELIITCLAIVLGLSVLKLIFNPTKSIKLRANLYKK